MQHTVQEAIKQSRIRLANRITLLFALLASPNLFLYTRNESPIFYTTIVSLVVYIIIYFLNIANYHLIGRLLLAVFINLIGAINHAYFIQIGEFPNALLTIAHVAILVMSFVLFAYEEYKWLILSILINIVSILSIPYLNPLFEANVDRTMYNAPITYTFTSFICLLLSVIPLYVSFRKTGKYILELDQVNATQEKKMKDDEASVWVNEHYLEFAQLFRDHKTSFDDLYEKTISHLAGILNAATVALFIKSNDELYLKTTYGLKNNLLNANKIKSKGIVQEVYLQKKPICLSDIPPESFEVLSGLGSAYPSYIMVLPITFREESMGVIEFGVFKEFTSKENRIIHLVLQDLAVAIKVNSE